MEQETNPFEVDEDLWAGWTHLPKRTRAAGRRKADAKHAIAQAKAKLGVMKAQVELEIRKNPTKFGLDTVTVDGVKAALANHGELRMLQSKLLRLEYEEDICSVEVAALVDLRKSYENKVQLLSIEYHSEREPKPLSRAAHETLSERQRKMVRAGSDVPELERD